MFKQWEISYENLNFWVLLENTKMEHLWSPMLT